MNNLPDLPSINLNDEQRKRFASTLEQYLDLIEKGISPDVERLMQEHPDLVDAFKKILPSGQLQDNRKKTNQADRTQQDSKGANAKRRQADEPPPRQLGEFELLEEIGRGGMGIVFRASQKSLDRTVAVKILLNAATWDNKQIARFQKEAQAAAQLNHPNIVSVYSVGNESETYFYTMPFIDGISLEGAVRRIKQDREFNFEHIVPVESTGFAGSHNESEDLYKTSLARSLLAPSKEQNLESKKLNPSKAFNPSRSAKAIRNAGYIRAVVEMIAQAAEALHYAHQHGIVHRDIKPSNLILDRKGNVWITDFGLAMVSGCSGLTGPGDIMGTLKYMSPEQAAGKTNWVDERTDIYSLGVTMYELLTLHPAVEGDDRMAMLKQIQVQTPSSIRKRNPAISRTLENILLKAISKYPEERYPTAAQFAEDLRLFLSSGRSLANRPGLFLNLSRTVRRNPQRSAAASGILFLLVIGLAPATYWYSSQNAFLNQRCESLDQKLHGARSTLQQLGMPLLDQLELYPGTEPLRKYISREQTGFLESLLEDTQRNPHLRSQIGSLRIELARLHAVSNPDSESLLEFQRAHTQIMEWDKKNVDGIEVSYWFQVQHELAKLRISLGLFDSATSELKHFLDTLQHNRFRGKHSDVPLVLCEAMIRLDLGLSLGLQESFAASEQELFKALKLIQSELGSSQGRIQDHYWSQELVSALLQSANLETTIPELGHELIHKALAIANAKKNDQVANIAVERQLAQCFLALGLNDHRLGKNDEAIQWFRRAIRITSRLVKNDPSNFRFQYEHATAINSLGQLELTVGKPKAAREMFLQTVDILEGISRLHSSPAYHHSLASALHDLATVAIQDKDTQLARSLLDRAIEEQRLALNGSPDDSGFQSQLKNYETLRKELGETN
jgi:serine/threonine protein kinase